VMFLVMSLFISTVASMVIASAETTTLDVICVYDQSKKELYEMFDKFQADHPEIKLNITAITSSADVNKQLTTLAVGGDLPDLVTIDRMYIAQFAQMGILVDVTEMAEADLDLNTFYAGPLDGCKLEDRLYGLPFTSNCLAVYYNVDLLKKAGLEIPTSGWTWSDYKAMAAACTDPENSVYGCIMSGLANQDGTFQYYPWLWAAGGDIFQPDSAATRESLIFLRSLIEDGIMSPEIANWGQTDASNQFAGGKAALFTGGTWHLSAFEANIKDFEWGVVTYPVNDTTKEYASCLGGYGLCLLSGQNTEAAWELVKFLESDEVMSYWNQYQNYIPVRQDIAEASEYFSSTTNKVSVFTESMKYAYSRGNHLKFIDIDALWGSLIQEVYTGVSSVEDAVANYGSQIDALVN
jgi:multiple sugar transport system substrate-binding protein